jgi:hypothetical protein
MQGGSTSLSNELSILRGVMVVRSSTRSDSSLSSVTRSEDEVVNETSLESFPASDPPAWVFGRDLPPPCESEVNDSLRSRVVRLPSHILEEALTALRSIRTGGKSEHP